MPLDALSAIEGISGKKISVYGENYDNGQMDQEGFLKVLLTSFSYQDPFETQDISKFIDNTVKLRELEIMKNFEDSVSALSNNDALFLNATNLIGESVFYKGDVASIVSGKTHIEFKPSQSADIATLYIYDETGNVVAQKDFHDLKAGESYSFDLDDPNISDGYYKVSVVAKKKDESVDVDLFSTAQVSAIQKEGGSIVAIIDGKSVKMNEIMKIGG